MFCSWQTADFSFSEGHQLNAVEFLMVIFWLMMAWKNLMEESNSRWAFLILLSQEVELNVFSRSSVPWSASSKQYKQPSLTFLSSLSAENLFFRQKQIFLIRGSNSKHLFAHFIGRSKKNGHYAEKQSQTTQSTSRLSPLSHHCVGIMMHA